MTKVTCFVLGALVTAAVTAAAHEGINISAKDAPNGDTQALARELAAMSSRVSQLEARVKQLETPRIQPVRP